MKSSSYDVVIIGAGISGTALAYTLAKYTDIPKIAIIEKHDDVAQVSSHTTQNSQTLHFGDIETNYTLEKAKKTTAGATLVKNYLETVGKNEKIFIKPYKMVFGVGKEEVEELKVRAKEFSSLFPKNKLLDRKAIAKLEPLIVKGRNPKEQIIAYYSSDGYTVDYYKLAKSFMNNLVRKIDTFLGEEVKSITEEKGKYLVTTNKQTIKADVIVCDAGAMSLRIAKKMGYAKNLSVLSVAGNFYRGPQVLKGKVYTVQNKKLPFAAVHGDPDVHAKGYTRFGPSAKVLFMLERRNYPSIWDYFASFNYSLNGWISLATITSDWTSTKYILKNFTYDIPFLGNALFTKNVRKIIPTIKSSEISKEKGYGATRPQIINTDTKKLALGEARILGKNIIFNITPSPGASTCLQNARIDTHDIIKFLPKFSFDEKQFDADLLTKQI